MIRGRSASMTVIVSWPLLATKTRRPSGDTTTFHGSAPVVKRRVEPVWKALVGEGFVMRMTLTELPAALATNAKRLDGSSAMLCGSSPTRIVRSGVFVEVRMTVTVSAPGLTTQTRRPSRDMAIGLEVVGVENVRRAWAARNAGAAVVSSLRAGAAAALAVLAGRGLPRGVGEGRDGEPGEDHGHGCGETSGAPLVRAHARPFDTRRRPEPHPRRRPCQTACGEVKARPCAVR